MVGAVADLVEAGRVKLYCVDSFDHRHLVRPVRPAGGARPPARRVRRLGHRPGDRPSSSTTPAPREAIATGCSMGAFHALVLGLTRADLFPVAICQSAPTTRRAGTPGASAATRRTSRTRPTSSRTCTATTSTGSARAPRPAGRRRGSVGDPPDRVAAAGPADGRPARRAGHPARARRLGPRLRPRLALVAASRSRTTCRGSASLAGATVLLVRATFGHSAAESRGISSTPAVT